MKRLIFPFAGIAVTVTLMAFAIATKHTDSISKAIVQDTVKIILEKTRFKDMPVLYIRDMAETNEGIKDVLGKAYGELMVYIQQNKLQARKFMGWYYSMQAPWSIDIAVETDSIPSLLSGRIQSRTQKGGEVIIAHMWGPYDQVGQAYNQIQAWLKDNRRKAKSFPFEVYINDPFSVKSPSEIQTDVYQPIE